MSVLCWNVCPSVFVLFPWEPNENPRQTQQHHQLTAKNEIGINVLVSTIESLIAEKTSKSKNGTVYSTKPPSHYLKDITFIILDV
jgi:hypothetical protein